MIRRDCAYFVDCHLRTVPVHRALIRAAEAALFAGVDLPRPLLDVGCGDGHFGAMVRAEPIDVGIDLNPGEVAQADRQGIYRGVAVASGAELPFREASLRSFESSTGAASLLLRAPSTRIPWGTCAGSLDFAS